MNQQDDLWPDNLFTDDDVEHPTGILEKQANALSKHTAGTVEGKLDVSVLERESRIYKFTLRSKDGYEYTLFSAESDAELPYPVTIDFDNETLECSSPAELRSYLATIFRDPLTRGILLSLRARLARADSATPA